MKKQRAIALMVFILALPLPTPAAAMDDMFGAMFRMMLVMMNVMSGAMLGNTNNSGFGSDNALGFGMGSWPAMNGLYGLNPISGVGGFPGMSPWSGASGFPGMSPWSGASGFPGMSPWSGASGFPGMSPWSGMGGYPGDSQGMSPWSTPMLSNPFASGYPPNANVPYSSAGYGRQPGAVPSVPVSLLDGRWYGRSGEILEVRGDRFRLVHGKLAVSGVVRIENNIVNLYSQQTGTVTQYSFIRNQTELMLQDASGLVLSFSKRPLNSVAHVF